MTELDQLALDAYWRVLRNLGHIDAGVKRPKFAHGARYMFHRVFAMARDLVDRGVAKKGSSPDKGNL